MSRWRSSSVGHVLTHPAFCGAVALLATNDHVLKERWPGLLTGKLSDLAGVFTATLLACAFTGASGRGAAAVVVGFTALKISPDVARIATPLFGGSVRNDVADLVALVTVWPAARLWRTLAGPPPPPARSTRDEFTSALLAMLAIGATLATTTATGCVGTRGMVSFVVDDADGLLYVEQSEAATERSRWYVSRDGGVRWLGTNGRPEGTPSGADVCRDDLCLRVDGRSVAERRTGAETWTDSLVYDEHDLAAASARSARRGGDCLGDDAVFRSVASVRSGGRRIDVVAMGNSGMLRRVDGGAWQTVAVQTCGASGRRINPLTALPLLMFAVVAFVFSCAAWALRRGRQLRAQSRMQPPWPALPPSTTRSAPPGPPPAEPTPKPGGRGAGPDD